jgi:chemotaxis response regulator CheB
MDKSPVVVAMAFSAGDLEPVSELLSALPAAYSAAFIIVQRLDSSREMLLLEERGQRAIGVVLPGEGSDGALGIQAIRRSGGATLAQYPGSARFPSMPINAIETGCVDFVLRPNEIVAELGCLSGYPSGASFCNLGGRFRATGPEGRALRTTWASRLE